ncbi:Myosin class II heavy chain [Pseudoloma neurophilia]|uniref:Myosin class II heavy chain n=1 Tax=Pseudoloma neurophilia TaxID=146866 RepID=A0A0R0M696_9MICR|nr:Myosin class II heavy chain [Pseudoloma neurophilia]
MQQDEGKQIWIKDTENAFVLAKILSEEKETYTVLTKKDEQKIVIKEDTLKTNPKKFDGIEDLSALSNLNEATVLHNLRKRYDLQKIYTYSGLFLVAMNPFKETGIYTQKYLDMYLDGKKQELPPHIFAVANEAYTSMLLNRKNQSILITGESGAGKTENTKKVISFLAYIAQGHIPENDLSIESKIIHTNPILEAFGNAQTVRNFNSSRFGKFIKITFDSGRITGATIEKYLLERSRVTKPNLYERNYHIFYQLLKSNNTELLKKLNLVPDIKKYNILQHTPLNVPGIDDAVDFQKTLESMKILGFDQSMIDSCLRIIAAILHLGNIEFSEKDDKTEICNIEPVEIACKLLAIPLTTFIKNILSPISILKKETLTRNRDCEQAKKVVDGFCRLLYENLFDEIIKMINDTLRCPIYESFIGVLDIAGFEIFNKNDFEQFCINFTNEKLQQFFNHHMFILEQEIYQREKIEWNFIDFGHDLSPTIELIESNNPIGILAFVDEECLMPKANEETLLLKLKQKVDSDRFVPSKFTQGFSLKHYAGETNYEVDGWLEKNKEPFFEDIFDLISKSGNEFVSKLVPKRTQFEKKGFFRTVAQKHKEQLAVLMNELQNTFPHFIRCILPNNMKRSDIFDNHFILHQLRCNGVLEGIRISRLGYPNRMEFNNFIQRYQVIYKIFDEHEEYNGVEGSEKEFIREMCDHLLISKKNYKIGLSKVFFKQGILAEMEEIREKKQIEIMNEFKAQIKGFLVRQTMQQSELKQDVADNLINDFKKHLALRRSPWWRIYQICKPLIDLRQNSELEEQQKQELLDLKEKMVESTNTIEKLQRILQSREFEKSKLDEEIKLINVSKNQLQDLIDAVRNENSLKTEELAAQKNQMEKLSQLISEKNEKFDQQDQILQKIRLENTEMLKSLENLQKTSIQEKNNHLQSYQALLKEKKDLAAQNIQLQSEIGTIQSENKGQFDNLIQEKDKQLIQIFDQLTNLKEEKADLERKLKQFDEKISHANDKQASIDKLYEDQKDLNDKISAKLKEKEIDLQNNILKINELSNNITSLSNDLQNSKTIISKLKCENEDLVLEIEKTENESIKLRNNLSDSFKDINDKNQTIDLLNERINNFNTQIAILKEENNQQYLVQGQNNGNEEIYQMQVKRFEKQIKDLLLKNKMLQDNQSNAEIYKNEIVKKVSAEKQQEIEKLLKEISIYNIEKKALLIKIKTITTENENLKVMFQEKIENSESSSDNSHIELEKKEELRNELEKKEEECMKLKNDLESLQERFDLELTELNDQINNFKQQEMYQKLNEKKLKDMKAIKENLEKERNQIETFLKSFKEIYQNKINHYRKEMNDLENGSKNLSRENLQLKKDLNSLERENTDLKKRMDDFENNLTFYKKHSDEITNELIQKNRETQQKENELHSLRNKINNLEISVNHMSQIEKEEKDKSNDKILFLENKNKSLNEMLQKYSEDYKKLYQMIKESDEEKQLREENLKINNQLSHLRLKNETLQNNCNSLKDQINQITESFNSLQNQTTSLKKQNELLNIQMTYKEKEIKNLKEEYETLQIKRSEILNEEDKNNGEHSGQSQVQEVKKENIQEKIAFYDNKRESLLQFENLELKKTVEEMTKKSENFKSDLISLKNAHSTILKEKELLELKKRQLERELADEKDQNRLFYMKERKVERKAKR